MTTSRIAAEDTNSSGIQEIFTANSCNCCKHIFQISNRRDFVLWIQFLENKNITKNKYLKQCVIKRIFRFGLASIYSSFNSDRRFEGK